MSQSDMAAAILAQLSSPFSTPAQFANALAAALYTYITTNATVTPNTFTTATGGPVTGTGKVT